MKYKNIITFLVATTLCGSPNIQVWANASTNEYADGITDNSECWCEDCGKHTKLKEV